MDVLKQMWLPQMPCFAPQRVCTPYEFDIKRSRRGYWTVRDRNGLIGGTFLTREDALRFALFEVGGDGTHIHVLSATQSRARRAGSRRRHGGPLVAQR